MVGGEGEEEEDVDEDPVKVNEHIIFIRSILIYIIASHASVCISLTYIWLHSKSFFSFFIIYSKKGRVEIFKLQFAVRD